MNIEELLQERGLTKSAFADLIGVKKQNINNLLKNPTLETLDKFAKALDVEMWELFKSKKDIEEELSNAPSNTVICPKCGNKFAVEIKAKKE